MPTSRGFRAMQIGVALLLLTAAGLKTHELATRPVLGDGLLESRGMLIAVVEFEYLFGVWLLAGLYPAATWRATMGLFTVFVGVSLYKAVSGAASCGCFGTVEVNPWYTVGLDLAVLGWLFVWRPGQLGSDIHLSGQELRHRLAIVCSAWLLLAASTGVVLASHRPTRLGDAGQLLADGRTVVLEPETWVGKRFPLLDWIETDAPLDQGQWTVILYRPACPMCEEIITRLTATPLPLASRPAKSLAWINVDGGYDNSCAISFMGSGHTGRLDRFRRWVITTPVEIVLIDGMVHKASDVDDLLCPTLGRTPLSSVQAAGHRLDNPKIAFVDPSLSKNLRRQLRFLVIERRERCV